MKLIQDSLVLLNRVAQERPGQSLFYLAEDQKSSVLQYKRFKNVVLDYAFIVEVEAVCSITLDNGSEVTFLPNEDAKELLKLPKSDKIFIETTDNIKSLVSALSYKTDAIVVVDNETKEIL